MSDVITKNATIENVILFIIDNCVTPISGDICMTHARLVTDLIKSDHNIKSEPFFIGYTPESNIAFIDEDFPRFLSFTMSVIKVFKHLVSQNIITIWYSKIKKKHIKSLKDARDEVIHNGTLEVVIKNKPKKIKHY